jgi:hypothetical protein
MSINDKVRATIDDGGAISINKDELAEYQEKHNGIIFTRIEPDYEYFLGELLAFIHRDGGHYQGEYGTLKAVEDAITIICDMRLRLDDLKDLKSLLEFCKSNKEKL